MPVKQAASVDKTLAAFKKLKDKPDKVLIIYMRTSGGLGSLDNELTLSEALYMVDLFKHWMISAALGDKG